MLAQFAGKIMTSQVRQRAACLTLLFALTGCAYELATVGKEGPNLAAIHTGSTRGEVELQFGDPIAIATNSDGTTTHVYEYEPAIPPSPGRAYTHAALGILTLGAWEVVGQSIEATMGKKSRVAIVYGPDDRVLAVDQTLPPMTSVEPAPKGKPTSNEQPSRDPWIKSGAEKGDVPPSEKCSTHDILRTSGRMGAVRHCIFAIGLTASPPLRAGSPRIPLAVGVYYSPELRSQEHVGERSETWTSFPLGKASVALFDRTLPMIFERVISLRSWSPLDASLLKVDGVLEPRIEEFAFNIPVMRAGTFNAEITYRLTLYSLQGDLVASWSLKGVGVTRSKAGSLFTESTGEAADLAMQDAARKILTGFRDIPEIRMWLRQAGVLGFTGVP